MYTLSRVLVLQISDLLCDIAEMKPGFKIYEKANKITKELYKEMLEQQKEKVLLDNDENY